MKKLLIFLYIIPCIIFAQQEGDLTHYEYWFDNNISDRSIIVISPVETFNLNTVILSQSLPNGLHTFHIRFKDYNQKYSETLAYYFYHDDNVNDFNNEIIEYEYWFDKQYSLKSTISIVPTTTVVLDEIINFDTLSRGLHTFNIRFKDNNQNWCNTISKLLYKIPNTLDSNNRITEYEYWFDEQYSLKSTISIVPTTTVVLDEIINYDSIGKGLHTFHLRFKDLNENWSAILNKVFYKQSDVQFINNYIVSYRYWFNNNTSSTFYKELESPVNPLNQFLNIEIPNNLNFGTHSITFQFKDTTGLWSITVSDDFIFSSTTQNIALNNGWNIMSFYVQPDDLNLLNILNPLVASSELTKVINEAGGFIQNIPEVGWMNSIGDMANTEGYYIKVSANTSFDVTGMGITTPLNIPLNFGWNIMGYPLEQSQDALVVLQLLIDNEELIKVINEAGGFIQNIPGVGWLNTIGNFHADEGYYIKVTTNTNLSINFTSSILSSSSVYSMPQTTYFEPCFSNNPYYPMNIVITDLNIGDYELESGDEIAVFDNNVCVGVTSITESNMNPIHIVASFDDPSTIEIDGFVEGGSITFKYMSSKLENPIEIYSETIMGSQIFTPLETYVCSLSSSTIGVDNVEQGDGLYAKIYPNPAKHIANIEIDKHIRGHVRMELINIYGKVVDVIVDEILDEGKSKYSYPLVGLTPGLYVIRLIHRINHNTEIKNYKFVILKDTL